MVLNQNVSANSSYTVPYDGYYVLQASGTGQATAIWSLDSERTKRIMANLYQGTSFVTVPLKQGTVLYTNTSGTYNVYGYMPFA